MDTSGPQDATVPYVAGTGNYRTTRRQTASEYVVAAAFTDTERGPAAELLLAWNTVAPVSPPNQCAGHATP